MIRTGLLLLLPAVVLLSACTRRGDQPPPEPEAAPLLLIVIDGLRVDYATPELMPNLTGLGARGVVFENHRAAFPSQTQVNAASLVTGAWPSTHGLLGDLLYDPRYEARPLRTQWAGVLEKLDRASGGRALSALTLGELLEGEDRDLLVVTSGPSGLGWILGYGVEPRPGRSRVLSPDMFLPAELERQIRETSGSVPPLDAPAAERDAWATGVFLDAVTGDSRPDLGMLWLVGPESAQTRAGVGSPEALKAVRAVDGELGRILEGLRETDLLEEANLFVTSDHGMIRRSGAPSLAELLAQRGLEEELDAGEIVVVDNMIHLSDGDGARLEPILRALGSNASVGGLFTRGADSVGPSGALEGTLSRETINLGHERAGDIVMVPNWNDETSEKGYPGLAAGPGIAGSGGASPYELRVPLVAAGPALLRATRQARPTAHVDLAPTFLYLLGLAVPESMDGRVLVEGLKADAGAAGGEPPTFDAEPMTRTYRARMRFEGGAERITEVRQQGVGGVSYLDWVRGLYRTAAGKPEPRQEDRTDASLSVE